MLKFELKTLKQGMNLFQVNKKHQNHVKNTSTIIPDFKYTTDSVLVFLLLALRLYLLLRYS